MLSPIEADLAARDACLPGLATVLDPEAFLAELRRATPAPVAARARIQYVKYSPENYCRVAYRLDVSGREFDLDVRACRPRDLDPGPDPDPLDGNGAAAPLGASRVVLRDSAVLVHVFPNDVKLGQLPDLIDPRRRVPLLRDLLPGLPAMWSGELESLRYWPGRRYSARLRGSDGTLALVKAYTGRGYRRARLNAGQFRSRPPLRVARVLGASERHRLIAFEWLPGRMLSESWLDPEPDWDAVRATGEALAALHAQKPDGLEPWTRKDEVAYVWSLAREIGFLHPGLFVRAEGVARRIASHLAEAPGVHMPLHGDLSDTQVLVDGRDVAIVDLDSARCGDPADDVGALFAQLESYEQRGRLPADRVETTRRVVLEGYCCPESGPIPERIDVYAAAGLLRRSRFAFRARRFDWQKLVEDSLERAEWILGMRA